ncbi:MAG: hypothetical protein ACU0B7_10680 [Paracoccaceae bacterium]
MTSTFFKNGFRQILFALATTLCAAPHADAATFEVEYFDLRPVNPPKIRVTIRGELVSGDAAKLAELLDEHKQPGVRDISFLMNSPGGSLSEGLAIGRLISSLPEVTTAQVGWMDEPDAICASACAWAYLGADYRYLGEGGRIGVHRFGAPGTSMAGEEALSFAQEVSAILTEYIRSQRADPAFYERMARTSFEGIDWVDRSQLEQWRVVTGPVYDEKVEYRNINGSVALHLSQVSLYGDNSLTLICGSKGLVGIAKLNKPGPTMYGRFAITVDGLELNVADFDIIDDSENFATVLFNVTLAYSNQMASAGTIGARVVLPSEYGFFGFEMGLRDRKLKEMVENCRPSASGAMSQAVATSTMKPVAGIDFPGGDMTSTGLRGIDLGTCLSICEADRRCLAISYVVDKQWCWPKSKIGEPNMTNGVISATK